MRSLYFKIFLWFWLTVAVVGLAFVISTATLQSSEAEARWRSFVSSGLGVMARSATEAYQTRGQAGLTDYFERIDRRGDFRGVLLYEGGGRELSGRPVPQGSAELVEAAVGSGELEVREFDDSRLVALSIESSDGSTFVMLVDLEWPSRGRGGGGTDRRRLEGAQPSGDRNPGGADGVGGRDGASGGRDGTSGGRRGGSGRGGGPRTSPAWYNVWWAAIDQPGALAIRMAAILLTAGVLCLGLARYLTAPVARLSEATHRFAAGDLSARVGATAGGRRDELTELGRDFDLMAERIEGLLTAQRQLLSDVSHELRSPLARLNVALGLARRRAGEDAAAPLDRIEMEADQLNVLIGRVLALARFESGAVEPDFAAVDLTRLVNDITVDADFEANPTGAAVRMVDSQPAWVHGDDALLRSAIENVVRNALRYTPEGTDVEVSVGCDEAPPGPGQVVVRVRDHGPGVPEEHLDGLFQPFYRIADARDRQSGGTGLGLSITDRAVRFHGGTVTATNAEGGGLLMEIRLPAAVNIPPGRLPEPHTSR